MNKRIAELTDKSGLYSHLYTEEAFKCREKFAELIVQACIEQCNREYEEFKEQAAQNNGRQSDFAFGSVNSAERIAAAIKEQFGVK